ncbi:MAG: FAD:protein FMN transferase [Acidimicrobiales bacterium]
MTAGATSAWVWRHQGLLGTAVEIRIEAASEPDASDVAEQVQAAVVAEMIRLESVFSVHDAHSELRRWRGGMVAEDQLSAELTDLLLEAARWHGRTNAAFSPTTGALMRRWKAAEIEGRPPAAEELRSLVDAARHLPYRPPSALGSGAIERVGDCGDVDLNAIAKGRVVDLACAAAWAGRDQRAGLASLMVNAGGDLCHVGVGDISVGVQDPRRPQDNAPPLTVIGLSNAALATSGPTRRGFRIGDRWYGHVVDPRCGYPVDGALSASVMAPDCTTADVVATVLSVLSPPDGLACVGGLAGAGVGCCVLDAAGHLWRNPHWEAAELRPWSP